MCLNEGPDYPSSHNPDSSVVGQFSHSPIKRLAQGTQEAQQTKVITDRVLHGHLVEPLAKRCMDR